MERATETLGKGARDAICCFDRRSPVPDYRRRRPLALIAAPQGTVTESTSGGDDRRATPRASSQPVRHRAFAPPDFQGAPQPACALLRHRSFSHAERRFPSGRRGGADRAARPLPRNAAPAQRAPVPPLRRPRLPQARGPDAGPFLQDPRRLQLHAQAHRGGRDRREFYLRLRRQPRSRLRLRLQAFRPQGPRVHAGDDAAAEDRQDAHVRRRRHRDRTGRRHLRRELRGRPALRRGDGCGHGAALRPSGHRRGPGVGRARGDEPAWPRAPRHAHPARRRGRDWPRA